MLRKLFSSLIVFLLIGPAFSQTNDWRIFRMENGLASNNIKDVLIEGPNAIWIASDSALTFYDGQNFTHFKTSNSNLPSNNIRELIIANGALWLSSDSGISTYNGRSFINYNVSNGLLSNDIKGIDSDDAQNVWIATTRGVSRFDGTTFHHDSGKVAHDIVVDDSNFVYILKYSIVFNIPSANLTVVERYNGQQWSIPPMNNFGDYYRAEFYKNPNGKIFLLPSGGGNQFYAELRPPFNLIKRGINTSLNTPLTPRFIFEDQNFRWLNYWGTSPIYRSRAKDSTYLPMYLLKNTVRVNAMDLDSSNTLIATDNGLLIGPPNYSPPKYTASLSTNQIKPSVNVQGALFHDYNAQSAAFEFPINSGRDMIYAANLQLGIRKDSNQLSYQIFPEDIYERTYEAGPYTPDPIIYNQAYLFELRKTQIDSHRLLYNSPSYTVPDVIRNWPVTADSSLSPSAESAPYADLNQNGCYEPLSGEYPLIKGDEAIYWINHPNDKSLKLEYHWMLYAFDQPNDTAVDKSVFLEIRLINRDTTNIDYIKAALRVDADLGYGFDDFNGSDSSANMIYFYNGDPFDDSFGPYLGYGANPPALGIRMLSEAATSATFFQNRVAPPNTVSWTFIHGLNGDSTLFINPITNQSSRFQYSGDPFSNQGWTEINLNPNAPSGNFPGDRRGTIGIAAFSLASGQSKSFELAFTAAQGGGRTGFAEYLPLLRQRSGELANFYQNFNWPSAAYSQNFSCNVTVNLEEQTDQVENLKIYPNPASELLNFKSDDLIRQIDIFQIDGRLVGRERVGQNRYQVNLSDFETGLYIFRIETTEGWKQAKVLIRK